LWLGDIEDDTKGSHLDFLGEEATAFHTALI